jgi:hypothetical protein
VVYSELAVGSMLGGTEKLLLSYQGATRRLLASVGANGFARSTHGNYPKNSTADGKGEGLRVTRVQHDTALICEWHGVV